MAKKVDPIVTLRAHVKAFGTQNRVAVVLGVSPTYIGDLLAGRRPFSARMLAALGLEKAIVKKA